MHMQRPHYHVSPLPCLLLVQEEQLEQAISHAVAETDAKLVQEMQQREEALSNALLEARASLGSMQRLHQASQNQLFTIQSQTEEQEVYHKLDKQCACELCHQLVCLHALQEAYGRLGDMQ